MPIFDQGYQHWKGQLSGHAWRWLAVTRQGVRAQMKNRITRLLLLIAWLPALALIVTMAMWGLLEQRVESALAILGKLLPEAVVAQPQEFRSAVWTIAYALFFKIELFCSLFLVLAVGPNLISRDLRFNALPLYLSRPLRRVDYFVGKLGVIAFFLAATVMVPATAAYVLGVAFSLDLGVLRDTYRLFGASLVYGLVIVVSAGTLMLALSSLSRRTIYVGLAWVGLWILSVSVSSMLIGIRFETTRHQVREDRLARWVQDHPPPHGIDMHGPWPSVRNPAVYRPPMRGETPLSAEEEAQRVWYQKWMDAMRDASDEAEALDMAERHDDWRPLVSYPSNIDRMGDMLLDTDSAWVAFGKAVGGPRAAIDRFSGRRPGPGGGGGPVVNERLLADRQVWQYPWYWSAGVLAALVLLSVVVLTRQVKSLDRLK